MAKYATVIEQLKRANKNQERIQDNSMNELLYMQGLIMARYGFIDAPTYKKRIDTFEKSMLSLVPKTRREYLKDKERKIDFNQTLKLLLIREGLIGSYDAIDINLDSWLATKAKRTTKKASKIQSLIKDAEYITKHSTES